MMNKNEIITYGRPETCLMNYTGDINDIFDLYIDRIDINDEEIIFYNKIYRGNDREYIEIFKILYDECYNICFSFQTDENEGNGEYYRDEFECFENEITDFILQNQLILPNDTNIVC